MTSTSGRQKIRTVDDPADPDDDGKLFVNERRDAVLNEVRQRRAAFYNARADRQPRQTRRPSHQAELGLDTKYNTLNQYDRLANS